jgi:hypothetical protein
LICFIGYEGTGKDRGVDEDYIENDKRQIAAPVIVDNNTKIADLLNIVLTLMQRLIWQVLLLIYT